MNYPEPHSDSTKKKIKTSSGLIPALLVVTCLSLALSGCSSAEKKEGATTNPDPKKENSEKTGDAGDAKKRGVTLKKDPNCLTGNCENGIGSYMYSNKDKYTGQFKNGLRDGRGIIVYANGDTFEGDYTADKKQGEGKYVFKETGTVFVGNFKDGLRTGPGKIMYVDTAIFEGDFSEDGKSGNGKLTYKGKVRECEVKVWILECQKAEPITETETTDEKTDTEKTEEIKDEDKS